MPNHSPYRMTYTPSPDANQLCFVLGTVPCDPTYKCCIGQDLYKLEIAVSECKPLLKSCNTCHLCCVC